MFREPICRRVNKSADVVPPKKPTPPLVGVPTLPGDVTPPKNHESKR